VHSVAFTEVNAGGAAAGKREPRAGIGIIVALSPDNRCLLESGESCAVLIRQTDWSHVVSLCNHNETSVGKTWLDTRGLTRGPQHPPGSPSHSLYVHTVCPGATAQGMLQPGDVLLKVDGEDVFRAPAPHVADLLLGQPGSKVALTVRRSKSDAPGGFEFLDFSVVRARTDPTSARKAVYEAFLSTSQQGTNGKTVISHSHSFTLHFFSVDVIACACPGPIHSPTRTRSHTRTSTNRWC
jgi:hypothetical protein